MQIKTTIKSDFIFGYLVRMWSNKDYNNILDNLCSFCLERQFI